MYKKHIYKYRVQIVKYIYTQKQKCNDPMGTETITETKTFDKHKGQQWARERQSGKERERDKEGREGADHQWQCEPETINCAKI